MRFRHLILDRDGVLNREAENSGYITRPEQFEWLPDALAGLRALHHAGVRVTVATNQSGVGRGLVSLEQLSAIHRLMQEDVTAHGAALAAVLFCPHAPEALCECRKPAPGLIRAAIAASDLAAEHSLVVGDDLRDLQAATRAGVSAALVRTGKGRFTEQNSELRGIPAYDSLLQLAQAVVEDRIERWPLQARN
jgi:D-glycero-D-manno-heptose 1,7-bisphosphate phosphatase